MKKVLALAMIATMAVSANAAVLWDQSDITGNGGVNQTFTDFPDFSSYNVSDITLGSASTITLVSQYMTGGFGASVTTGVLNIFAKTGATPGVGDNPATGTNVAITFVTDGLGTKVVASGLSVNLAAGSYWIGITPNTTFGTDGQQFALTATTQIGDKSATRNPGGGFGFGTGWFDNTAIGLTEMDNNIHVEGSAVPEPASMAVLGLGAAALLRRRKK